jgi:aminopeptidase N
MSTPVLQRPASVLLLLLAASVPATAQAQDVNAARVIQGSYSRSHDYDLVHQRIEVRNFDWDSTSFDGHVATTVIARRPGLDSLVLDAGHLLDIESATSPDGTALRTSRHGDTLALHLPHPAAFGDTLRFDIAYHARIQNGRGLTFIQPQGRSHRPQQIWSQGEDMDNHDWFPTYDFPNDKESWELVATVPTAYSVVSNGAMVSDSADGDGNHTVTWREDLPSATYLVSLIVAPLVRIHDSWHGKPVDYYVYAADSTRAWRLFHITPDMIDVYSQLTGVPYPWAKYAQTTVADFFGGMENVSATTLVDWLPDTRAYADRPWYQWLLIPHELAHQWFGDYVTTADWANTWLNEGFAEFMPGQYWRVRDGKAVADDYYMDEYQDFMRIDARRRMPLAAKGSDNIYPRGALVLRMLRDYLGDAPFWAGLHRYLQDHALGDATSDDLRQAFLDATGENLEWFFDEWVYGAGYPELDVTAAYDTAGHSLSLHVAQTQKDTATADSTGLRYATALVFRMPVTIRVGTASGNVIKRTWLDARDQTIDIDSVASPPTMVVFDDGDHILKKLSFQQPTAWLAEELRRDADLWDEDWAIQQLAGRTADPAAGRTLAAAATGAAYYRTRAAAVGALASFPAGVAGKPVAAALRDTSAQVRAAAIQALGTLGGRSALATARRVFQQDSSYAVRAAALIAATHADPRGARSLLRAGLAAESYRDEIRDSALSAIAETRDTTFVPDLVKLLGGTEEAPFTLALLGAHGSTAAVDALVAHLNDERAYVRDWALRAIVFRLPHDVAAVRLQRAEPTLRYADTRAAVQRLLGRIEH